LLASWSRNLVTRVNRLFGSRDAQPEVSFPNVPSVPRIPSIPAAQVPVRRPPCQRFVVFSDTDNDVKSVKKTLRFVGVLGPKGKLADDLQGVTLVHTGDLLDKKRPDFAVVKYWRALQYDVAKKGGHVRLIAGNHEQEIRLRFKAGQDYGLEKDKATGLIRFVESLDLFHVTGSVLFIHSYPTVEFLQALLHYRDVTGRDLNRFNEDHYARSSTSPRAMKQYAYVRTGRKPYHLLYDVADARSYFKKNGRVIGDLLSQLGISCILHGHKPQRSGSQADQQFSKWIPDIRIINNDTNVRRSGIGATVIRERPSATLEIVFVNANNESKTLRRKVRGILGVSTEPPRGQAAASLIHARDDSQSVIRRRVGDP